MLNSKPNIRRLRAALLTGIFLNPILLCSAVASGQQQPEAERDRQGRPEDRDSSAPDQAPAKDSAAEAEAKENAAADSAPESATKSDPDAAGDDAEIELDEYSDETASLGKLVVVGEADETETAPGSAQALGKAELERFEQDNVHQVLNRVPGVYTRGEDGLGLRPNIGMRGANSDRSKKVTLTEDGILFAPAPYSAPAAYYFPLVTRMVEVQVFKGPSSILYGPHTVGGAINFRTHPIPHETEGSFDFALGQYEYGKAHFNFGVGRENAGFLIEGVHLRTDGFKTIDEHPDESTGFEKNELMLKGRINTDLDASDYHELAIKLGLSTESSHETYVGLTDADFHDDALRRYASTERALMEWWRTQVEFSYTAELGTDLVLKTTAYRHDFDRSWEKLNRFAGAAFFDVLTNPESAQNRVFLSVLKGEQDSSTDAERLLVGTNARRFVSQGIQFEGSYSGSWGEVPSQLDYGIRYHFDQIERDHTEEAFEMREGGLVHAGLSEMQAADNTGETHAVALWFADELMFGRLSVTPGMRVEVINMNFDDRLAGEENATQQTALIPGLGVNYAVTDELTALGGVYRGFSPATPTLSQEIEPEFSVNYEAGGRYLRQSLRLELIGFLNQYTNLLADCSPAECPLAPDSQINAGEASVYGLEFFASNEFELTSELDLPLLATYTFTTSELVTSFKSNNPQLGDVEAGDELPYIPHHQASLSAGLKSEDFGVNVGVTYVGSMRESAGQGDEGLFTDEHAVVMLSGDYMVIPRGRIYAKVDNLLDSRYIVSRRPFGARPGSPRWIQAGLKYSF